MEHQCQPATNCILSIHLYSTSCSAHQSEALPVWETQREEWSLERTKEGTWLCGCNLTSCIKRHFNTEKLVSGVRVSESQAGTARRISCDHGNLRDLDIVFKSNFHLLIALCICSTSSKLLDGKWKSQAVSRASFKRSVKMLIRPTRDKWDSRTWRYSGRLYITHLRITFHAFSLKSAGVCPEGARWSSGIEAAIGARGRRRGSRPVHYLTVAATLDKSLTSHCL